MERKLAAILYADVYGYTRLMGEDEETTLCTLTSYRTLIGGLILQHRGRFVNSAGDSVLAEFVSVVEAVNCAVKIQTTLRAENTNLARERRMKFRIGVNLGDVMIEGEQIYGDGVNVAARIESLAEPGGICISERVYDEIRNKPEFHVKDLGEQRLKNVSRSIRVYALEESASPPQLSISIPSRSVADLMRNGIPAGLGALLIAVLVYGIVSRRIVIWRLFTSGSIRPGVTESQIRSIAVLPLENLSGDPGQEYFADGLTEELITDLAKISALRVISRTSVMRFKGERRKPLPEIAKALNVDAVVEGSVLRIDDKVRITAQLIDASTDKHLWAESYERDSRDVMALEDELASAIAREINVELTPQEKVQFTSARTVNPEAHEAYLKGRYFLAKWTQQGRKIGKEYFELAIKIDPNFALGYAGLADYYWQAADWDLPDLVAMPKGREFAIKALKLDDSLAEAHTALGSVSYFFDFDSAASEGELRRAIALNPGYAEAHHVYGWVLTAQARFDEAQAQMKEARQLDPLSSQLTADLAMSIGLGGRPGKALEWCSKALDLDPGFFGGYYCRAMNYDLMGNHAKALAEAQRGVVLEPVPLMISVLGYEYALVGHRREAQNLIEKLSQLPPELYVSPFYKATIYLALGDKQKVFDLLTQAYQERSGSIVFIGVDRRFDGLRSDPRFKEFLKKIGLVR